MFDDRKQQVVESDENIDGAFPAVGLTPKLLPALPMGVLTQPFDTISVESLANHIAKRHLGIAALAGIGVPIYDLEISKFRKFNLDFVLRDATNKILLSDQEPSTILVGNSFTGNPFTVEKYREYLAKTIIIIRDWKLHTQEIEWNEIEKKVPRASSLEINWQNDSGDISFEKKYSAAFLFREKYLGGESLDVTNLDRLKKITL